MEVFQTENHYIFVKRQKSLWWNRLTSEFAVKSGWDLSSVDDIGCIGIVHGIIGVISLPNVYEPHLVVIKEIVPVGVLYSPHLVYKIKSICILSADEPDTTLAPCTRHWSSSHGAVVHPMPTSAPSNAAPATGAKSKLFEKNQLMNKTWGAVKSAGNTIKTTTQQAAAIASNQVKSSVGIRDRSRIEKRITEELHRIFDDSDSFYFCFDSDVTNNLQRRTDQSEPDERFFWNKHMVEDILKLKDTNWILPIIQGFVQVEQCVVGNECFTLALVSRRSRHRAGTRYKRRGVDDNGNCANYVETEQILSFRHHQLSFTQVRGSVPIFWSQPGYKYRPPPRLDRGEQETHEAFVKHFTNELLLYDNVCIVNLVEQSGKEKVIGDSYAKHVLQYDSDRLIYVTFDFHDYCRGMRFENVSALVEALAPEAGAMGFHWRDHRGIICNQRSVFRVNCMDCLDRTNVVQTAIGKAVLESQLVKLGLSPPYTPMPEALKAPFMILWANNGDIISRQYAGTNALKGDYTRTGERKFTGMMKDGMNSANRYYLARFKDSYRQATVDLMLGKQVSPESLNALGGPTAPDDTDAMESAEHAKLLIEDCRRLLLGTSQYPVGAWGLIDADPISGDMNETEVDSILLLTDDCYIVAEYDSHLDKIVRFEKVRIVDISAVELGTYQQSKFFPGSPSTFLCLRLNYVVDGVDGYFHMLRSANIRFFNTIAYVIKTQDEVMESLMAIVETFRIALENAGKTNVPFSTGCVLQRRKSKNPYLDVPKGGMPRNLSESQLIQLSSKAISNVAGQFSKLGQSLNPNRNKSQVKAPDGVSPSGEAASRTTDGSSGTDSSMTRTGIPIDACIEAEKAVFVVGRQPDHSADSSDSEDISANVDYDVEFAMPATGDDKSGFKESDFLPSVGIVMCNSVASQDQLKTPMDDVRHLEDKGNTMVKNPEYVAAISISSVTDNVTLPTGLLENATPVRPITPNPQICIEDETGVTTSSTEQSRSSSPKDPGVSSGSPQLDQNKLMQLRTMARPLSKLAKGMQNLGLNLDPRKIATKTGVLSPANITSDSPPERSSASRNQLVQMWEDAGCRTKLIAL